MTLRINIRPFNNTRLSYVAEVAGSNIVSGASDIYGALSTLKALCDSPLYTDVVISFNDFDSLVTCKNIHFVLTGKPMPAPVFPG